MSKFKENQKKFIVEEAAKLFVERTIEGVTMTDIAKEIGIGEATLYRYFGKKETIVCLAGAHVWDLHLNKYYLSLKENNQNLSGYDLIVKFYNSFYYVFKNDAKCLSFILNFDNYASRKKIPVEELEPYDSKLAEIKNEFDKAFKIGVEDNSIRADIDRDVYYYATTRSLLSMVGKLSQSAIVSSDRNVSSLYQIEMIIDIFTKYIRKY